ncbi:Lrp/AsnC family transcriptional regulator [Thiohalobacter sp.]|uniref:Lrp/AsnC family transcriptional regulator n=1 Tax=Thiohalobacter sp. TaxID=2025948 RepID=UPI0026158F8F|nr:Lrp/AsnC family transcriptional regulator [Thiohalobacter sp.]
MNSPVRVRENDGYSELERHLLNDFQRDFPLCERPYAALAEQLGVSEQAVLDCLADLQARGVISRIGPVFRPNRIGASTLVAARVDEGRLEAVADMVSAHPEVNHNYQRDDEFNLWFVVTAENAERLQQVLDDIGRETGCRLLVLPMEEDYFLDLGFDLRWSG